MARTTNNPRFPTTINMDEETKQQLKLWAEINHSTVSQIVTDWIYRLPVAEEIAKSTSAMLPNRK